MLTTKVTLGLAQDECEEFFGDDSVAKTGYWLCTPDQEYELIVAAEGYEFFDVLSGTWSRHLWIRRV